jgi:hypothetical protein
VLKIVNVWPFQFLFDITGSKNKYMAAAVLGFTQCANFVCKSAIKGNFMNPVLHVYS